MKKLLLIFAVLTIAFSALAAQKTYAAATVDLKANGSDSLYYNYTPSPVFITWKTQEVSDCVGSDGANDCSSGADKRLNIAGSVIANAGRGISGTSGTFVNNRTLCKDNWSNPSVSFIERPDFILNYPSMAKQIVRAWQDVAP